jgi:hypothetical protein
MSKKIRSYELYTFGAYGIYNQTKLYRSGMWVCDVFAHSIKQAYFFVANKIVYNEKTGIGIFRVDNSHGPDSLWIWPDELWPEQWGKNTKIGE